MAHLTNSNINTHEKGKDAEERRRDAYITIKKKAPNVTPRRERIIKKKGPK